MDSKIIGKVLLSFVVVIMVCIYALKALNASWWSGTVKPTKTASYTFSYGEGATMAPPLSDSKTLVTFQRPPKGSGFYDQAEKYPSHFTIEQWEMAKKSVNQVPVRKALAKFSRPSSLITSAESVGPIYLVHQRQADKSYKLVAAFFTGYQMGADGSSADNSLLLVQDEDDFALVGLSKTLPRLRPLTRAEREMILREVQDKAFTPSDDLVCSSCLVVVRTHNSPAESTSGLRDIEPIMDESQAIAGGGSMVQSFWVTDRYFFDSSKDIVYAIQPPKWWR